MLRIWDVGSKRSVECFPTILGRSRSPPMRNVKTMIIPPRSMMTIKVDPMMAPTEKPIALTLKKTDLELQTIGNAFAMVINKSDRFVPVMLYIGPKDQPPSRAILHRFLQTLLKGSIV